MSYMEELAKFDYTDDSREIAKEEYREREKRFVNQDHEKFKII